MADNSSSQPLVMGLLRGLSILRCFDHGRELLGSSEIARMTGLPQPTVWRLCKTLQHGGYLIADAEGSRFRPGLSILTLGYAALDTLEIAELARPLLQDISTRFRGAASLSTREGASMLYLQRSEASNAYLTLNVRPGSEVPIITSGTGWAYLAGLQPDEFESVLDDCRKADPGTFKKMKPLALASIKAYAKKGFVTNIDVFLRGLTTIALPIISNAAASSASSAHYVLNVTTLTSALETEEKRRQAGAALRLAAEQLRPIIERADVPSVVADRRK